MIINTDKVGITFAKVLGIEFALLVVVFVLLKIL